MDRSTRTRGATALAFAALALLAATPAAWGAASVTFTGTGNGTLTVTGTSGADVISVGCFEGNVHAMSSASFAPTAGNNEVVSTVACSSITDLVANGMGGSDTLNLGSVTNANGFVNAGMATARTLIAGSSDGNDVLTGTGFADDIGGGAGGTDTLDGQAGDDKLTETFAAGGVRTIDDALFTRNGASATLASIETAHVTGSSADETLHAENWTKPLQFDGVGGEDRLYVNRDPAALQTFNGGDDAANDLVWVLDGGDVAITDSAVSVGGVQVATLIGVEQASVTGTFDADFVDFSAFGGFVFTETQNGADTVVLPSIRTVLPDSGFISMVHGGLDADTDTLIRTANLNATLTDTQLANPAGAEFAGFEAITLVGGASANTFNLNHTAALEVTASGRGGADVFNAGPASTAALFGGAGGDQFDAQNGVANAIDCGNDSFNVVVADQIDTVAACLPDPPPPPGDGGGNPPPPDPEPVPASPAPGPAVVVPTGFGLAVARTVTLRRDGTFAFTVACPVGSPTACAGVAALRRRQATLGTRRFTVASGATNRVRLKLSRRALRTLRRAGRLRVKLTVTVGGVQRTKTFTLKSPTRARS